jgi:hypothetical protein
MAKSDEIGVEATTMAIRELLMEYFKGTCVDRMTANNNIRLVSVSTTRAYQYQRRQAEYQQPKAVTIGGIPIMNVQKSPEKVVFNTRLLNRSPQLSEVYKNLKVFMDNYLGGVEVKHNRKGVIYVA